MIMQIKKCIVAVLAVASACFANAQETSPDHIKEIFALAKKSAEDDFNINFGGFFTGMSRYDAQDLAAYYKLKDGEYLIVAEPGKAVSKLCFSLKGVRRITRGGSTLDELAQAVANRVGNMKRDWESGMYEHRTIDGVVVKMGHEGLSIEDVGVGSKKPLVTKVNAQKDVNAPLEVIQGIIGNLVAIPGKNYKIGKTEVTQAQWGMVMGKNPSNFKGADNPVENVSWDDCQEFLKKLNALPAVKESGLVFRLPTEKEWEYACRAGATGDYCKLADGTEITKSTLGEVAWYDDNSNDKTHPVGQKKPNAFGLYDMHGNVWEWCEDLYRAGRSNRVNRGGGWCNNSGRCTAGNRDNFSPGNRYCDLGFRLAASRKIGVAKRTGCVQSIIGNMVDIPGKNFKMGKFEVTQRQWVAVMGDNPSQFKGDDNPVEKVSWNDCKKFLEKLNAMSEVKESGLTFRLPTEKEWEYACRAGAKGKFCRLTDGTEVVKKTLGNVAWYKGNSGNTTHPVGQKMPNAFGLYDMHGNVHELCEDLIGAGRAEHVRRGGSLDNGHNDCAVDHREDHPSDFRWCTIGFRLAASQK